MKMQSISVKKSEEKYLFSRKLTMFLKCPSDKITPMIFSFIINVNKLRVHCLISKMLAIKIVFNTFIHA